MFNNLNETNQQNRSAVDDIFAETDKATPAVGGASAPVSGAGMPGSDIETHRVGLTSDELMDEPENKNSGKWFKIVLMAIVAVILILSGYLAYSKFFKADSEVAKLAAPATIVPVTEEPAANTAATTNKPGTSVEITNPAASSLEGTAVTPLIPGVNTPVTGDTITGTSTVGTSTTEIVPVKTVDSDNDGLTDTEEKAAGTNINIIDTDNDGLSDYEEVNVYHTNPLSADTDGDGFLDGAEVKGGYNPNGAGKMPKA